MNILLKLSICFTVYNQIEMLKENLDEIVKYENDDIEVVVSDDCSEQNIEGLVDSYKDCRIVYYRTENNLGHDLNILYGLQKCKADYVYLFRTRDNILCENISKIMQVIENYPNAGYFLFSAVDENKKMRLNFENHCYKKGEESMQAHFYLPVHPSGNLYNKKYLRFEVYEEYIRHYFNHIYGFSVHQLIRSDFSAKADFITSSVFGWKYANTLAAEDTAVNKAGNGVNVYAPKYCYPRYRCEFNFVKNELPKEQRLAHLINIVHHYYIFIIYKSKLLIADQRYNNHYASGRQEVIRNKELKKLNRMTLEMVDDLPDLYKKKIMAGVKKDVFLLKTYYPLKGKLRNFVVKNPTIYGFFRKIIAKKRI